MKNKTTNEDESAAGAAQESPRAVYEVLVDGPLKIGGVLAYKTARVNLTKEQADTINANEPGALRFLGV